MFRTPLSLTILLASGLVGCATGPLINKNTVSDSRVEISYVLGHNHYKYTAVAGETSAEVSSVRDNKILEKKSIPLERYHAFAGQVENVLQSLKQKDTTIEDCRTPYTIRIAAGGETHSSTGCRSADSEGKISQILKEGEFLLYAE